MDGRDKEVEAGGAGFHNWGWEGSQESGLEVAVMGAFALENWLIVARLRIRVTNAVWY